MSASSDRSLTAKH